MQRRNFIETITTGTAAGIFMNPFHAFAGLTNREITELDQHTISDIKFTTVKLNYPRQVGRNSHLGIHGHGPEVRVGIVITDKGAHGWGMLQGGGDRLEQSTQYVKGKKVTSLIDTSKGVIDNKALPFDVPLHDLAGIILNKPVYELMGRTEPLITNCYSGMIYFDDLDPEDNPAGLDKILEECQYDYDYGYRQFKLKIGRGYKWMPAKKGMQRDIEVTQLVAENFPDCDILVDANNGYTLEDTITYLEGIGNIDLYWIEEPFHENKSDYKALRKWLIENEKNVFLADAEANPDQELMGELYKMRVVDFHLTDTIALGFTPWRQLMPELISIGTSASPHAWGQLFKSYYNAHLAGALGNVPTIEGVTCFSEDVDFGKYELKEGKLYPSSGPGFGMELVKGF